MTVCLSRKLRIAAILFSSVSFLSVPLLASAQGAVSSGAVHHDKINSLRNIAPSKTGYTFVEPATDSGPFGGVGSPILIRDLAAQRGAASSPLAAATPGLGFDGVGNGFTGPQGAYTVQSAPPDTTGAIGRTQYVQWVNSSFAVFDKTSGNAVYGPVAGNTLWTGFGGKCETQNDGDPIVQYDKAADRWVMTQFAVPTGGPFFECVAVSQTSDATGAYNRYAFQYSGFNDYPKLGVWPDAYYITFNMFSTSNAFTGTKVCAYDRAAMLAGRAATQQCVDLGVNYGGVLPADLDGSTPPPAGSPNYLISVGTNNLNFWKFKVDWATPSNTRVTGPTAIPVAAFNAACGGGTCIPQPGTTQQLDSLADRMMFRFAYRNFGDHESLLASHSVQAGTTASAVRWYEIRNPSGTPTIYQQSSYAPDSTSRWMGSVAMDKQGNMAAGYSVSSSTVKPSLRYATRLATDAINTLSNETTIVAGNGSQLPSGTKALSRWGDYTHMSIDPVDDCTFWYTGQYLKANGSFNWSTRITSFKLPSCGGVVVGTPLAFGTQPANTTVAANTTATFSVSVSGGTAPYVYNWYKNGSLVSAGNSPSYSFTAVAGDNGAVFKAVVTDSASPVASVTSANATLTVTTVIAQELMVNGGFESGTTGWTGTTGDIGTFTGEAAFQGTKNAWMGGNGSAITETLAQTVSIPSTATTATLSFYLHIDTAETGSTVYDKLTVQVRNTSGTVLKTLATYSNVNAATGYQQRTFDLSAYKGQTIQIYFTETEDASLQTSFVLDNVSLISK